MDKTLQEEEVYSDYEDQFQWFLAFALFFILIDLILTQKKINFMREIIKKKMKYLLIFLAVCIVSPSVSQNERKMAREGNSSYDDGNFSDAEIYYRKSLSKVKEFDEVKFNLSDALFKQDRYDESNTTIKHPY